jgi:hypothetical protein
MQEEAFAFPVKKTAEFPPVRGLMSGFFMAGIIVFLQPVQQNKRHGGYSQDSA